MLRKYLQERNKNNSIRINDNVSLNTISPLPANISISKIATFLRTNIPASFLGCVDGVYIVHLTDFDKRNINALYKDNAIYVTNKQSSEQDLLDDIVHELAHAIEEKFEKMVYSDGALSLEFRQKRSTLWDRLKDRGHEPSHIGRQRFVDVEYDRELDEWFFNNLGYENLQKIGNDLFASPYGVTSLREYWANGFENYILGGKEKVRSSSPSLFEKIEDVMSFTEEYHYQGAGIYTNKDRMERSIEE